MLQVEMLSTGDEVLHGQIVDTNAAWLADYFFNQGLPLTRRNTVGDDLDALVAILRERSEQADVLIVNGGLGPTSDIFPLTIFHSCGISSTRVLRMNLPNGVIRRSSPSAHRAPRDSASTYMERNL